MSQQDWIDRDKQIRERFEDLARSRLDHGNELKKRLKLLVEGKYCDERATGWLTSESREGHRKAYLLSRKADGKVGEYPALRLRKLAHLADEALLTLIVVVDRSMRVLSYGIGLQGVGQRTGQRWYARIDLTETPEGNGPCSHPLLHCHVGADPSATVKGDPEARVPLPPLTPAEALDWLLATADPRLEPGE